MWSFEGVELEGKERNGKGWTITDFFIAPPGLPSRPFPLPSISPLDTSLGLTSFQSNIRVADDEDHVIVARSKVYAGNLSYKSTSEDLKNLFTPVGGEM